LELPIADFGHLHLHLRCAPAQVQVQVLRIEMQHPEHGFNPQSEIANPKSIRDWSWLFAGRVRRLIIQQAGGFGQRVCVAVVYGRLQRLHLHVGEAAFFQRTNPGKGWHGHSDLLVTSDA
jgi:hypothetical protein